MFWNLFQAIEYKQTKIQVFCWAFVQVYTQNGVSTLALSMDDYGRTELTETFQQRCFDFIARGLEDRREEDGMCFLFGEGGR